ncbi:MAG: UDP-3-O-(3-hydroxymyristoyl)glucosamine N-acyltransferase [Chlamydiota bacterium]
MMHRCYSLKDLSLKLNCELIGDPNVEICNVDSLDAATETDASFLANLRYREKMLRSRAGVICIDDKTPLVEGKNFFRSADPSRTFQQIAEIVLSQSAPDFGFEGIHPTAIIHPTAKLGNAITIGPHVVVGPHVTIGDQTVIIASSFIGAYTTIGSECLIYPTAIVRERCALGHRVILQPGAIIGSCGFGYTIDPTTGQATKLDQLGTVIVEDDVEIGANTTIDRARFKETRIKKGTKIDNLVQIGHNVELGNHNIIVAQSGIAGSSKLGNHVIMGGQAGIVGHVTVADKVQIATRGGVSKSIAKSGAYGGGPVVPMHEFNKRQVYLRNIESFVRKIKSLEKKVSDLEQRWNQGSDNPSSEDSF